MGGSVSFERLLLKVSSGFKPTYDCVFCGPTLVPLTYEDVFPVWLSKAVHARTTESSFRYLKSDPTWKYAPIRGGTTSALRIKTRSLCRTCNNQWLSDFENRKAGPLVTSMLDARRDSTVHLTPEQQNIVAAWVFKMAVLFPVVHGPGKPLFTLRERRAFRASFDLPNSAFVWLAHRCGPSHRGVGFQVQRVPSGPYGAPSLGMMCVTVIVLALTFQVLWSPSGRIPSIDERWDNSTALIWPNRGQAIEWPLTESLDDAGLDRLLARWTARHKAWVQSHFSQPKPIVQRLDE